MNILHELFFYKSVYLKTTCIEFDLYIICMMFLRDAWLVARFQPVSVKFWAVLDKCSVLTDQYVLVILLYLIFFQLPLLNDFKNVATLPCSNGCLLIANKCVSTKFKYCFCYFLELPVPVTCTLTLIYPISRLCIINFCKK